jgi:2,5-diketo-D-gluconate reductase A
MTSVPTITLNNGLEIPQLGYGVFQVPPEETKAATLAAFEVGYRHIDTAEMYRNEKGVGEAVRESGLPREELFITSKLNNSFHAHDDAMNAFEQTLATLDIGYLDLFLIHWPLPAVGDFVDTWKAMIEMQATGKVRSIGVSNFQPAHIRRLLDETDSIPSVNQIEVHPYLTQEDVRAYDFDNGIATEAWSPIAQGLVLEDPVLVRIADTLGKSTAQVTLRWHIQRGDIVFPKSIKRERMVENFEIFDFELSDDDMDAISGLNRDERTGPDPDTNNWVPSN